ncbi:hypothetical protein ACOMHN_018321 [Nucella lapillus]
MLQENCPECPASRELPCVPCFRTALSALLQNCPGTALSALLQNCPECFRRTALSASVDHIEPLITTVDHIEPLITTVDHIEPLITTVDHTEPLITTVDHTEPLITTVDHTEPLITTVDHIEPLITTVDHIEPLITTVDHTEPLITTVDHIEPLITTVDHTEPLITTVDHTEPLITTVDHTAPLITTVDHTEPLITTVDHIEPLITTVDHTEPLITTVDHTEPLITTVDHTEPPRCYSLPAWLLVSELEATRSPLLSPFSVYPLTTPTPTPTPTREPLSPFTRDTTPSHHHPFDFPPTSPTTTSLRPSALASWPSSLPPTCYFYPPGFFSGLGYPSSPSSSSSVWGMPLLANAFRTNPAAAAAAAVNHAADAATVSSAFTSLDDVRICRNRSSRSGEDNSAGEGKLSAEDGGVFSSSEVERMGHERGGDVTGHLLKMVASEGEKSFAHDVSFFVEKARDVASAADADRLTAASRSDVIDTDEIINVCDVNMPSR